MGLQAGGSCDGGHLDSLKKMNTGKSGQSMIMIFIRFIERAFCALGALCVGKAVQAGMNLQDSSLMAAGRGTGTGEGSVLQQSVVPEAGSRVWFHQ